jgi:hypothetical protein
MNAGKEFLEQQFQGGNQGSGNQGMCRNPSSSSSQIDITHHHHTYNPNTQARTAAQYIRG